ncbi:MAG: ABC transporter permease [Myxococcaceae bacterium]
MRTTLAIARKELSIYFTTPLAYFFCFVMAATTAFFFVVALQVFKDMQDEVLLKGWSALPETYRNLTDGVVMPLWGILQVLTLFAAPFLSMRLFAEEKRHRTFELLMTAPVRPIELVIGKYLGGLGVLGAMLGVTLIFPALLALLGKGQSGSAIEWSTVWIGYFGLLLWGATCMAIGLFVSSLTESQMLAALVTFALLLVGWMLNGLGQGAEGTLRSLAMHLAFRSELQNLMRGVLELKSLVYFASVILLALVLTHRSIEAQRWLR